MLVLSLCGCGCGLRSSVLPSAAILLCTNLTKCNEVLSHAKTLVHSRKKNQVRIQKHCQDDAAHSSLSTYVRFEFTGYFHHRSKLQAATSTSRRKQTSRKRGKEHLTKCCWRTTKSTHGQESTYQGERAMLQLFTSRSSSLIFHEAGASLTRKSWGLVCHEAAACSWQGWHLV